MFLLVNPKNTPFLFKISSLFCFKDLWGMDIITMALTAARVTKQAQAPSLERGESRGGAGRSRTGIG